ncbi:hypothetical protein ACP6C7_17220 [Mycolicibacterium septicum]|uniref:Uncharacterized protein n=1 Tax=Mycolicibacterium septicum TaxID=98668 RepID=A0ABW9LR09_9MYCO
MAERYPPPLFGAVIPDPFVYVGWSVDPVRIGPFLRPSAARRLELVKLRAVARDLSEHADVLDVRLFQTSVIVPIAGAPLHDVVMLIRARDVPTAAAVLNDAALAETGPLTAFTAENRARFGVTEDGSPTPNVLLNHFTGPAEEESAIDTWRALSAWFGAKTGVDNSTLLVPDRSAPYVLVNYARIPGAVPAFMARQLLRPSFYRFVRRLLAQQHLTSLPIFVRPVDLKGQ